MSHKDGAHDAYLHKSRNESETLAEKQVHMHNNIAKYCQWCQVSSRNSHCHSVLACFWSCQDIANANHINST